MARRLANKQKYPQPLNDEGATKVIRLKNAPQPKTESQRYYMDALETARITVGTGPAGGGKSFLAMAVAVQKLLNQEVNKVIITRPVVEAGESLGFLPGTLEDKISPYLLPLLDALTDLVGPTMAKKLLDDGRIEFAPLAFMRGRTFKYSYVILDEAQNTTPEQMKLFLTRIGEGTQMAVNGDPLQSDLRGLPENGLELATRKLRGVDPDIIVCEFYNRDIVRDPIVGTVLQFLESPDARPSRPSSGRSEVSLLNRA